MLFDLKNEYQIPKFKEYVNKLFSERAVVEVKKKLPNRTLAQNSYLHLLLGYFGSEYGCSLDEAKIDFYKRTCNRDLFERKTINKKGKEVTYLRSSAELTTGEMTLSIDRFRNWSATVEAYGSATVKAFENSYVEDCIGNIRPHSDYAIVKDYYNHKIYIKKGKFEIIEV
nr:MAG TPA: NinB recombination protein [Caudoviricetes sp.]